MDSLRSHIDNMHIQPIPSPSSSLSPTRSTFRRTPSATRSSFAVTADSADPAGDSLRPQNTSLVPSLTLTRSTFRRTTSVSYIQVTSDSADPASNSLHSQHMPMPLVPSLTPSRSTSRYSSSASYVVVDSAAPVGSLLALDVDMDTKATERQRAVEWVSPIDFSILHQEISKSREINTGDWLLEHPAFEDWYLGFDSSNRLLWCSGASGVGKTVLVSKIVDHLQQKSGPHIGVACLYLRYQETITQTLQNLMGAVWRQLASDRDIDAVVLLHQRDNKTTISLSQIQDLLHSASKQFLHIYIVVDAVDEYVGSQVQLLDNILAIGPDVKLLTTSRRSFTYTGPRSIIEIVARPQDLQAVISSHIMKYRNLKALIQQKPALRQQIMDKLLKQAHGSILMLKLMFPLLSNALNIRSIEISLDQLPQNLEDSFQKTMHHIQEQSAKFRDIALLTLFWITYAKQPLSGRVIQTVLALTANNSKIPEQNELVPIQIILNTCAGLVVKDIPTKNLELVHYTAHRFLERIQPEVFPRVETRITSILLLYLKLIQERELSYEELFEQSQMMNYCQYFLWHASGEPESMLKEQLMDCLNNIQRYPQWSIRPWSFSHWPSEPRPSALWLAVAGNLLFLAQHIIETEQCQWSSELTVAAYYGYDIMTELLLLHIDVNYQDHSDQSALHKAACQGHIEITRLLLEAHINVNLTDLCGQTALHIAASYKHTEIVRLLLETHLVKLNITDQEGQTALYRAVVQTSFDITQLLVTSGADVNIANDMGQTPLHQAVIQGDISIVKLLLSSNADINYKDQRGRNALYWATKQGHYRIGKSLLPMSYRQQTQTHALSRSLSPRYQSPVLGKPWLLSLVDEAEDLQIVAASIDDDLD